MASEPVVPTDGTTSEDRAATECVFCQIVAGEARAAAVYRDERVMAFLVREPVTPGHLLVIPNEHHAFLGEVPPDLAAHVFVVAQRLAGALRSSGLPCEGINLFYADGEAAFQEVFHAHLHVFARTVGDGFSLDSPAWQRPAPAFDELAANAAVIKRALE